MDIVTNKIPHKHNETKTKNNKQLTPGNSSFKNIYFRDEQ
jgi:hypothetical protein